MQWNVNGTIYPGFKSAAHKAPEGVYVCLAYIEGEVDVWMLEDNGPAMESLKSYYAKEYWVSNIELLVFKREQ